MFEIVVQEVSSTKAVCLMDPGKDIALNISVLRVVHFTVVVLQQVTHLTTVHCSVSVTVGVNLTSTVVLKRIMPSMRTEFGWLLRRC
jgi:hypothetical protein